MSQDHTVMAAAIANAKSSKTSKGKVTQAPAGKSGRAYADGARDTATYEKAAALCPTATGARAISQHFGFEEVDDAGIRETAEECLGKLGNVMAAHYNERAMPILLQGLVGNMVYAAFRAGNFFSEKVSEARAATSRMSNEGIDEDRDGGNGWDSQAQRKREFAAVVGLQARAALCAAEGFLSAYEHLTGEAWKPYANNGTQSRRPVSREAAAAQLAAFGE